MLRLISEPLALRYHWPVGPLVSAMPGTAKHATIAASAIKGATRILDFIVSLGQVR